MVWLKKRASSPFPSSDSDDRPAGTGRSRPFRKRSASPGRPAEPRISEELLSTGGTVTNISFQQHSGADRLNVFLDGEYAFSLSANVGMSLHEGDCLVAADIRH